MVLNEVGLGKILMLEDVVVFLKIRPKTQKVTVL